jgi:tripeptidyl-peptidase-1
MRLVSLLALPFATVLVGAVSFKLKETIHGPPYGWYKHAVAPKHHVLELKIALPQPKFPVLEQHLWEVSDPTHARYGAHLSKEETDTLMAPHPETLYIVGEWLASYGLAEDDLIHSSANDWVTIRVPVGLAEEMLNTVSNVISL